MAFALRVRRTLGAEDWPRFFRLYHSAPKLGRWALPLCSCWEQACCGGAGCGCGWSLGAEWPLDLTLRLGGVCTGQDRVASISQTIEDVHWNLTSFYTLLLHPTPPPPALPCTGR